MNTPIRKQRPYLFYDQTQSLCETCLQLVPTKIIFQDEKVFFKKRCSTHGFQTVLVSTDIAYYKRCKEYLKPGDLPQNFHTQIEKGCPYDCGLCPDHEQHTCLGIIEIIDECNLKCPVCFSSSGPGQGAIRSLTEIKQRIQFFVESEKEPDLVQISGGEPTLHPDILEIIDLCQNSPIRHTMLNTNGLRLSRDLDFVKALAQRKQAFEVYLQFDSLKPRALQALRGSDLSEVRLKALQNLEDHHISTTLVCVLKKGVNETEINHLIKFAQQWRCVRGISFQPIQDVGRNEGFSSHQRLTLSEIRRAIILGDNSFNENDMVPLPCHPEHISIGYAIKSNGKITPVTSLISKEDFLSGAENSVAFEHNPKIKQKFFETFSLASAGASTPVQLKALLCCLPKIEVPNINYEDVFRITIISFMDKHDFCLAAIKRSCIHFIEKNRIYPFETYNMFYRNRPGSKQAFIY